MTRIARMRTAAIAALIALGGLPAAQAQLTIKITSGVTHPVPIAVVPFAETSSATVDVAAVVQHDLVGSGRFSGLSSAQMPATPHHAAQVAFPAWKATGVDYLVVGRVKPIGNG